MSMHMQQYKSYPSDNVYRAAIYNGERKSNSNTNTEKSLSKYKYHFLGVLGEVTD